MLELNKIYAGFSVKKITAVPDVKATAYQLEHAFSGAKLLYLQAEDDNKVFTIGFRTPSQDNTGVAHIMEHSVLCGSRKYDLKEPFVELVKGSMNTFLNAMTYSDKTVYPVASRNAKDFQNLMDVYLDAVFYPLIHENPYTLLQEGWHYEIEELAGELSYNGVVYNEMKGVYSSADAVEENECYKALFPNSPYRFESGGFPAAIPELTLEGFRNFHKTYYSPENAYIYLYGDMDIEKTLAYIDREYLQAFSKTGKLEISLPLQETFERTVEVEATYPIGPEEETENKSYLSLNIVTGKATEQMTTMALHLLCTILLDGNSAPLRLALLEAGIGSDITGEFAASQLQPVFSIKVGGAKPENRDKFISVIYKTLQAITIKGLDKDLVEAHLNSMEFKLREADFGAYPKGLIYGLNCFETWLYGGDPTVALQVNSLLKFLREKVQTRYFEGLIENFLLDNTHKVLLTLTPEPGKEEKQHAKEVEELKAIKAKMSAEEIRQHIAQAKKLHELQATDNSPEALSSIPILEIKDIRKEIEKEHVINQEHGSRKVIYLPAFTNKIVYANWYFDMTGVEPELLPYVYLLCDVLGKMNTPDFTYQELTTYTNKYTGGIGFQVFTSSNCDNMNNYTLNFALTTKVLEHNTEKLFNILENITLTNFSDKARLREIVEEIKTEWDSNFFNRGMHVAVTRLGSYFGAAARVNECDQLSYYVFLKDLVLNYDKNFMDIQEKLKGLLAGFFHKDKQLFAYSCEKEIQEKVAQAAELFVAKLPNSPYAGKKQKNLPAPGDNEGIITAGKVQYVVAGGNYRVHGYEYSGAMKVAETILRYEYLWTKIRVQGGAYGANVVFDRNGGIYLSSYRDPKLAETLATYRNLPAFLEGFAASKREMTKYIIGTISALDTPLTNSMHLSRAVQQELKEITDISRQISRDQILNTQVEDIRALASLFVDVLKDNHICVVGSKDQIEKNKALFGNIIKA